MSVCVCVLRKEECGELAKGMHVGAWPQWAGCGWKGPSPIRFQTCGTMQAYEDNLLISKPALHNVYMRLIKKYINKHGLVVIASN